MRKSQFIFVLMLSTSVATMARADDTSLANCLKAKEGNCVKIEGSDTYYALSGDAGNQTMTIGTQLSLEALHRLKHPAMWISEGMPFGVPRV